MSSFTRRRHGFWPGSRIRPNPQGRPNAALVLDGDGLAAKKIALDGRELDLHETEAWNGVRDARPVHLERAAATALSSLEIETEIDASANTRLMGLYRSGSAYCTQCEAEGFRRITYFLDRPDVLSVYTVRLEAEISEAPLLLSNGNKIAGGKIEGTIAPFRGLARSLSKALLSVRPGRRRSRVDFR